MELEEYSKLKPGTPVEINMFKLVELLGNLSKIKKTDSCRIVGTYLGNHQISIPLISYPHEIILKNIIDHDLINNVNNINEGDLFRINEEDIKELFSDDARPVLCCDDDVRILYSDGSHIVNEIKITDSEYSVFIRESGSTSFAAISEDYEYFKIKFVTGFNIENPDDIDIHPYRINFYYRPGLYNGSIPADRVYLLSKDSILCDLNVPHGKISFVIERNKKDDNDELAPSSYFIVTATGINLGGDSNGK